MSTSRNPWLFLVAALVTFLPGADAALAQRTIPAPRIEVRDSLRIPTRTNCDQLRNQEEGNICYDTSTDVDGDGTADAELMCYSVTASGFVPCAQFADAYKLGGVPLCDGADITGSVVDNYILKYDAANSCFDLEVDSGGVGGGSGDMEKATYDTAPEDGVVDTAADANALGGVAAAGYGALADNETVTGDWSFAGTVSGFGLANFQIRYQDIDTDNDGSPDERLCGDYNGDGSLDVAQDVKPCIEDFNDTNGDNDLTAADLLVDTDGDGAVDHTGRTVRLLPGTYRAGFRDTINVGGITLIGAGDSTFIDVVGDCDGSGDFNGDGTVDSLDNGDTTANFRQLFLIEYGRFHIEKMAINGGSSRWEGTKLTSGDPGYCNINDVDEDAIVNVSDPAPGGTCVGRWCPVDSHYIFVAADDGGAYYTFKDITVQDVDRTAFSFDGAHDFVLMDNVRGKSMGEHTAWAESEMTVSNSTFENCGRAEGGYGFVFAPNSADIINTKFVGNQFIDCPGAAIGLERPTGAFTLKSLLVEGNTFRNTATGPTPQRALVEIIGDSTAPTKDIAIVGNVFDQGTSDSYVILFSTGDSATAFDGVTISGNTIRWTAPTSTGTRGGFSLNYATNLAITNNFVSISGDTNDSLANSERGIQLVDVEGAQLSGNVIEMTGQGVIGINLLRVDLSTVSNNKITGPGYTASELESRGIVIDGTSGNDSYSNIVANNQIYNVRQGLNPRNYAKRNLFAGNFCDTVNNCAYPEHATNTVQNTFKGNLARACDDGCYADNAGSGSNFWDSNISWDSFDFTNIETGHGINWITSTGGDDSLDATSVLQLGEKSRICGAGTTDTDCNGVADAGSGETNTASNLGAGTGVFAQKSGVDLQFKSLVAGTNVTIGNDANTVTINSSAGSGLATVTENTASDETYINPNELAPPEVTITASKVSVVEGVALEFVGDSGVTPVYNGSWDITNSGAVLELKPTATNDQVAPIFEVGDSDTTSVFNGELRVATAGVSEIAGDDGLTLNKDGDGDLTGDLILSGFASCTALETDASGVVSCGVDDTGGGGGSTVPLIETTVWDEFLGLYEEFDATGNDATSMSQTGERRYGPINWWYRESIIGCMFDRNTSPPTGAPGVWRLECPANQGAAIFADDVALLKLEDVDEYEFMASIRVGAWTALQVRAGYTTSNGSNSEPSSGIYFSLDGSGNWQGECRNASVSTLVTSAVSSVGIHSLRFNYDASVPDVEFFVDGTSIGTCSTNLPPATTAGWPVKIQMVDSGNTFPWIDIDGAGYTLRWDTEAR